MAVVELRKSLIVLIILYAFAALFAIVAAIPMIMHVYPQSECLLFSTEVNQKLFYGHYASKDKYVNTPNNPTIYEHCISLARL